MRDNTCHSSKQLHDAQIMDRLVATVTTRGMMVFARIDDADGAAKVGMTLRAA